MSAGLRSELNSYLSSITLVTEQINCVSIHFIEKHCLDLRTFRVANGTNWPCPSKIEPAMIWNIASGNICA